MFNPSRTLADYGKSFGWPMVLEQKDNTTVLQATKDSESGYNYKLTSETRLFNDIDKMMAA